MLKSAHCAHIIGCLRIFQASRLHCSRTVADYPTQRGLCSDGVPAVSSRGRIKSRSGKISYGYIAADGYCVTAVGGKMALVHRLVARAFHGPPPTIQHCDVHHIDGVRSNNDLQNLEYATRSQNIWFSWRNNPNRGSSASALSMPVRGRPLGVEMWRHFKSMREAERMTGAPNVGLCCAGACRQSGGWEFQRVESTGIHALQGEQWADALHPDTGVLLLGWEISSFGRVRSSRGHVSWGTLSASGYRSVGVSVEGHTKRLMVHRIVARSFLKPGPPLGNWVVNHKDGDPNNNRMDNLEYATHSENLLHSYMTNRRRRSNRDALAKPIWGRPVGGEFWQRYSSGVDAAKLLGLSPSAISSCCRGQCLQTKGFEFKFAAPAIPDVLEGEE
ncbi:unnamed protein product [Prorocentrum cordatum]|uniref:HNH nuclease domain-containing protein n=1 Tax=Prorocentrum cordatum TaxID=2364126 RepID=A0ABN9PBD7_9DINO|nr:unnamed protein product [Polarella glacialis]